MVDQNILKHVAIIMDGNGRWAQSRSHPRVWGHTRGAKIVSDIVEESSDLGIEALTLYTFSVENWSRPEFEISTLFKLLLKFLKLEKKKIIKRQVCFRAMGDLSLFPDEVKKVIDEIQNISKDFKGLKLTLALGYGGRQEVATSVNKFIKENPGKEISERDISAGLYLPDLGDVDLLIRTGGDLRISNFLLWQVAYGELFFSDTMWPDFNKSIFKKIVLDVSKRERRFGAIEKQEHWEATTKLAQENKNNYKTRD